MKYIVCALLLLLSPQAFSHAQIGASLVAESATIQTEPTHPAPNELVRASLDDYALANLVSSITWRVDSQTVPGSENQRSIEIQSKAVGESTMIEATIGFAGGGSQVIRKTITPLYLDIIAEPQTRVPAFYAGRGLPSVGSLVTVTALLHGTTGNPNNYLYTWRVNNQVIEGGAVRGKNKVSVTVPIGRLFLLTVDISTPDGGVIMRRTIELPSVTPELYFYEANALYGTKNTAFTNLNLIGDSVTVKAEPYHLDIRTYNNPGHLEWKLNNVRSTTPIGNPYEITFARGDVLSSGTTDASLHVRNLDDLMQGTEGGFKINF
jgi:hypothetical protein